LEPWNGDGVALRGTVRSCERAFFPAKFDSGGVADITFTYGPAGLGWKPIVGDWNGDGVDTVGLYDPANAAFFLRNSNLVAWADITFTYGPAGLVLDSDVLETGTETVSIQWGWTIRPHAAFLLRNSNSGGIADLTFNYGAVGWTPITGDCDGLSIRTYSTLQDELSLKRARRVKEAFFTSDKEGIAMRSQPLDLGAPDHRPGTLIARSLGRWMEAL